MNLTYIIFYFNRNFEEDVNEEILLVELGRSRKAKKAKSERVLESQWQQINLKEERYDLPPTLPDCYRIVLNSRKQFTYLELFLTFLPATLISTIWNDLPLKPGFMVVQVKKEH